MINLDLVRLINSSKAWAFIGSGVSVDAGLPSWGKLLVSTAEKLRTVRELSPEQKLQIEKHSEKGDLPRAFEVLGTSYGKGELERAVGAVLGANETPGKLHQIVAGWPFASYITTNYDLLQETSLRTQPGGWVSVGNTASENAKVSKDVTGIVWHPHGAVGLGSKNGRLVITSSDYDETYPSSSPTYHTLEAVLRMCQVVFIGFGFTDPDLMALLKKVSRFSSPGNPAYAFLHDTNQEQRDKLRLEHNIEVIPYHCRDNDHSDLLRMLRAYGSFVIDRKVHFGADSIVDTGYDPTVTSLVVQNRIHSGTLEPTNSGHEIVMRASVLSSVAVKDMRITDLRSIGIQINAKRGAELVTEAINTLRQNGLVAVDGDVVTATDKGRRLSSEGSAAAELKRDQFLASLLTRAQGAAGCRDAKAVAVIAGEFFEAVSRDRGLGVAQSLVGSEETAGSHRTIALIQELPKFFSKCPSKDDTFALIDAVTSVLRAPTDVEREYLGLLTQAYFGRHLAKFDVESIELRRQLLNETVFICDSHFLIPLLARGSVGHQYARELFQLVVKSGARLVATDLLLVETMEHADFARRIVAQHGEGSVSVFDATRAANGYRPNAFLQGYASETGTGVRFLTYLNSIFPGTLDGEVTLPRVQTALESLGMFTERPQLWTGFVPQFFGDQQELENEITRRRVNHGTFKHERQVKAEAEVATIASAVRAHRIRVPGHDSGNAFFLSHSRVIDNLEGLPRRLTITPESLFQWLLTVQPISVEQTRALFDQLLYDLAETGQEIVGSEKILRSFSGVIQASKDSVRKVLAEHREIVYQIYGEDPAKAFIGIGELELPDAAEHIKYEVLRETERRRKDAEARQKVAEAAARSATSELENLQRFKAKQEQKRKKAMKAKRAAQSAKKKRKRK